MIKRLKEHQAGLLAVFTAALMWSTGGLFVKLITFNAMQISFFRCSIAALVFAVLFRKRLLLVNRITFINAVFYASVLIAYVIALKMTTAANAIFLQSTAPIYVLIFEPIILKTSYNRVNIMTILICTIGMFFFFMGKISPAHFEGNLIALFSGIMFAALFLGLRKNESKYQLSSIFYGNVIVALVCIPFLPGIQDLNFNNLWMVSFLGVFQIGLAYAVFSYGLRRVLAIEASIIALVEPVLNPVWVYIGYGEVPAFMAIVGGIIILSAITMRTLVMETPMLKGRFKI
jgi:drug/metabolite transporter (DMT)-like permease